MGLEKEFVYKTTLETTLGNLREFQSFHRRNYKEYEHFENMSLVTNQLGYIVLLKHIDLTT